MSDDGLLRLGIEPMITLEHLAEGAANVVYRIVVPPRSPSAAADLDFETGPSSSDSPPPSEISPLQLDPRVEGKVVRLKKDLPSMVPVIESYTYFQSLIAPLFDTPSTKGCLVEQTLFRPSRDLLKDCNTKLRKMEADGSRSPKRHGSYLSEDEQYGILVTDMSSGNDDYYACVEFKPKWLAQSPSAPTGSKRCRTCALRAMKSATEEHAAPGFCPLSLVSHDIFEISTALSSIISTSKHFNGFPEPARTALLKFLYKTGLLESLKNLQVKEDRLGVLQTDPSNPGFLTAMALRDCTLFLKVPRSGHGNIEACFGDLDLKAPHGGKAEYWKRLESKLIDEGWYTGTEEPPDPNGNPCLLRATTT